MTDDASGGPSHLDGPAAEWDALRVQLARSLAVGAIGTGPVEQHLENAARFARVLRATLGEVDVGSGESCRRALDLGTGGGVPGVPLVWWFPRWSWWLLEARSRRATLVREMLASLGLLERAAVIEERAERLGRDSSWRGTVDVIVARAFGSPAVTAECAAPLLTLGGLLLVSEPPGLRSAGASPSEERWPPMALAELGLQPLTVDHGIQVLRQEHAAPDRYPRRVGIPAKRPLF